MTPSAPTAPGTAANLLFGSAADAAGPLAQQITSAAGAELDRTLRRLPEPTRQAAVREAAAAAAGLLDVSLDGLLLAGWRLHHDLAGAARRTLGSAGSTELVTWSGTRSPPLPSRPSPSWWPAARRPPSGSA
jgi:hypothetical protein